MNPDQRNAIFLSDLHHFARRSQTERYDNELREKIVDSDALILGGDIFDFRWSTVGDFPATTERAIQWLGDISQINPRCKIHYLLGNHDCHSQFLERLQQEQKRLNLSVHPLSLRLGDKFFIHGDIADRRTNHARFLKLREHWSRDYVQKPLWRHWTYDLAVILRLHKLVAKTIHRKAAVVDRMQYYLKDTENHFESGIREVYFGHTHHFIDGEEYDGIRYFNPGAPMAGLEFKIFHLKV